jgi:xylene monooxygenase electron transfer component
MKVLANGRFNFIPVLSQEPDDSNWTGLRGRCVDKIMDTHNFSSATNAYLCGPPAMIDSAIEILNKNGLPNENIYYDKFLDASTMKDGRA